MATITLYKDKINGVGSLLDNIIKSSNNFDTQLGTLKNTLQGVNSSNCNLQDTIDSISSSSKSEKEKVEDLKKLNRKLTDFITTTARRDSSARDQINKKKNDFYTKYSYLKPECEKSTFEKLVDSVKKVCAWCKEHWKLLATIAIVVVAVALLCTGVGSGAGATLLGKLIAGACWGAIMGACIGGVSGGLESMANGGSFLDGFEDGAFSGAVSGAISGAAFAGIGAFGAHLGKGIQCVSKLGKFIKGTAAVTKVLDTGMSAFDMVALADKAFGSGKIAEVNSALHENKAYNYFQTGISVTSTLTGGMTTTMKCFVAGTLIHTLSGVIAIENLKKGDYVLSSDSNTMETGYKPILETYVKETNKLIHLIINGEEIITTFDHPFYVNGQGFVNAVDLYIGTELVNDNGDILIVESIYREVLDNETRTVYNFKVDEYHTYFVGNIMVLVHNADYNQSPKEIMTERTKDLDTQEHPSKYKQISAKEKARLEAKVKDRTITKEEYKILEWNKKMTTKRSKGVRDFWNQERNRLLNGENGTRNWTPQQKDDIINRRTPTFNGKPIQGHHTYSVSKYPHLADKGEIIYPSTSNEHLNGWHGGNYHNSLPGEPIKIILDF